MFGRLLLLFTLTSLAELWLLLRIGKIVGVLPTLGLVIGTGIVGVWLMRREGRKALTAIREQLEQGRMPTDAILDGIFVLVAGILLLAPGVITDTVGLLVLLPGVRRPVRLALKGTILRMIFPGGMSRVQAGGGAQGVHFYQATWSSQGGDGFRSGGFPGEGFFPGAGAPGPSPFGQGNLQDGPVIDVESWSADDRDPPSGDPSSDDSARGRRGS